MQITQADHDTLTAARRLTAAGTDTTALRTVIWDISPSSRSVELTEDNTHAFAFGYLAGQARSIIERLQRAEARVAELEAANGVACYCGWYGPGRDSDAHRRDHENA